MVRHITAVTDGRITVEDGTAGTPSADVMTVQGKAGMTPLVISSPGLAGAILQSVTTVTGAPPSSTITGVSKAAAAVVTTAANHGLRSGETVTIAGGNSTVSIDGTRVVTVTGLTTFTVPVDTSGGADAGTTGTVTIGATPVPATPLAGRVVVTLQACLTNTASVWVGSSTVTADYAATGGVELFAGQSVSMQISATTIPYARSTVASQKVAAFEVAS